MRTSMLSLVLLPLATQAVNVVLSNDDGWAEINIREFYSSLTKAGFNVVLSAPAENESGTGSSDATPTTVGGGGCEFRSCPAGSPPYGKNASMPRFNYVNSYPVTSMRYGIQNLSQTYFGGPPDIAVAGPNVGANLGLTTQVSGTVGAATEAVKEGIPGLAFSGTTGTQTAWNTAPQIYEEVYADLSTTVTQALVNSGKPYLPSNIWLNVNYPAVSSTSCSSTSSFEFVLSRINSAVPLLTPKDVVTCNNGGRLPTETTVVGTAGCYASISVGIATTKLDASAANQQIVLTKLKSILSCLPS
ncbi:hypothetical protein LTR78_008311 [Recurvomyces mirabilis]|uniref:Survival protein SurE-like phosphatase/nucleotidase domain-containing protein n=1 Tax=Recurvomyces mirabilis TaxID=574656 RepID=A0AAE0TQS2_9PEZI|nr:hypothetical protein LTR78_008311 [Recurvomyces mirabilis]